MQAHHRRRNRRAPEHRGVAVAVGARREAGAQRRRHDGRAGPEDAGIEKRHEHADAERRLGDGVKGDVRAPGVVEGAPGVQLHRRHDHNGHADGDGGQQLGQRVPRRQLPAQQHAVLEHHPDERERVKGHHRRRHHDARSMPTFDYLKYARPDINKPCPVCGGVE